MLRLKALYGLTEKAGLHLGCEEKGVKDWSGSHEDWQWLKPLQVSHRVVLNKIWKEKEFHKARRGERAKA